MLWDDEGGKKGGELRLDRTIERTTKFYVTQIMLTLVEPDLYRVNLEINGKQRTYAKRIGT